MKKLLWEPSEVRYNRSNMVRFMKFLRQEKNLAFENYEELYRWSIYDPPAFWQSIWQFTGIKASCNYESVAVNYPNMLETKWFVGAEMNFAENLLRYNDGRIALISKFESSPPVSLTYAELNDRVARLSKSMREIGVAKGDRVAGYMPNMIETVIAMLATASLGAIWSSCSPDFGVKSVLDRFGQFAPKVLFTVDHYSYNGKSVECLDRIASIQNQIPSIEKVVIVTNGKDKHDISYIEKAIHYIDFIAKEDGLELQFTQVPFNHPLYVLYSSGTTGVPKCIIHGTGGTLIQHLKELILHTDLKREDIIFYFTTCGWMMWNWLVSSLAIGATLVLFDGSPFFPDAGSLWKLVQDLAITVFGTSAKYLTAVEKAGIKPGKDFDLSSLKTILSTGSPLVAENYDYVYRDIKQDVCLSSISGGTDIISCFCLGNPIGPVYAGELQCRGLGMKVESFNAQGQAVFNEKGEMVCTAPFPSMPIGFWNDPGHEKYKNAYFDVYPGVWRHGDYIEIRDHGGVVIYGRSDATLNPGGVRIGTAEIYRLVELMPEIQDSLVVGQDWDNDVRIILFVKQVIGVDLNAQLRESIKRTIRENASPRHVPAMVIAVPDIPYTLNGKKVELVVRNIIQNNPVLNADVLVNPEILEHYRNIPELSS